MDKQFLVDQLMDQLRTSARVAADARRSAADEARDGATAAEKREDARKAIEFGSLARAQDRRAHKANAELDALAQFRPQPWPSARPIALGALVEIEDEDQSGRTFFLAPVGAGMTLNGPGGDGIFSVVTPSSPIGRAVLGRRTGDVVDVTVDGDVREWTITWVG